MIEVLTRLVSPHGAPRVLRSHNGPAFVRHALLDWLARIDTAPIDPGKPWQNGDNESFNATNASRSKGSGAAKKRAS